MSTADEIGARIRQLPRTVHDNVRSLLTEWLPACAAIFGATEAVAVWEDLEQPGLTMARYSADGGADLEWREIGDSASHLPLVADPIGNAVFYDSRCGEVLTAKGLLHMQPLSEGLQRDLPALPLISFPVYGETLDGRIFIPGPALIASDARDTAAVVAPLVELAMDAALRLSTVREVAAHEERTRVARDLHDGLLQSFTGVVLQLETVHALVARDPESAGRMLNEVQAAIMSDQRELRAYVESLRPRRRRSELVFDFGDRLDEMRRRFEAEWGIRLRVDSARVEPLVVGALGLETFRIVQEAVTNSAKHGGASRIDVHLRTTDGMLLIDVTDDGSGLPVHGRLTLDELRDRGIAPRSLGDRVAALNGELTVESNESGLKLEIAVPLGWSGR
jgi:signal transduction histidine kinase